MQSWAYANFRHNAMMYFFRHTHYHAHGIMLLFGYNVISSTYNDALLQAHGISGTCNDAFLWAHAISNTCKDAFLREHAI